MVLFIVLHDVCLAVSTKGTIERGVQEGVDWSRVESFNALDHNTRLPTASLRLTRLTAENTPVPNLYQRSLRLLCVQIRL